MHKRFLWVSVLAVVLGLNACVSMGKYNKLQDELTKKTSDLQLAEDDLSRTKGELASAFSTMGEIQGSAAEKEAALAEARRELEAARARLVELDQAQKAMEESLKSELEQKTIRINKLRDRLTVTFVDKILFDSGKASVKEAGKSSLKKVADSLKDMKNHNIVVEGHTDNVAIRPPLTKVFPSNWELSTARATAVVRFLQDVGKIEPERLSAAGCSSYQPVADNKTEAGRSENRRVEIVLMPRHNGADDLAK